MNHFERIRNIQGFLGNIEGWLFASDLSPKDRLEIMTKPNCVLVTGVTGFLGKVVLEHLVRQHKELKCTKFIVLVRGRDGADGERRFRETVVPSACFSLLLEAWDNLVEVVTGDLLESDLGILDSISEKIQTEITHIIHCAGCVKFDRALAEAAAANVSTVLNILEFARKCTHLQHLVSTSTAYVTPHRLGPIRESLTPLPYEPSEVYRDILDGKISETELLNQTKHPNTYTLSKCIAEHMLVANSGSVPLTIVRPSIISASWRLPFPGWIDSFSAFAGFLAAYGNGLLGVIDADSQTILDIVPVDEVANRLLDVTFQGTAPSAVQIKYATASLCNGLPISMVCTNSIKHFLQYKAASFRSPKVHYLGPRGIQFHIYDTIYQKVPLFLAFAFYTLSQNERMRRRLVRVWAGLASLNRDFPYFTHHSFNFRPSTHLPDDFEPEQYLETILHGVRKHLLRDPASDTKPLKLSKPVRQLTSSSQLLYAAMSFRMSAFAVLVVTLGVACVWRLSQVDSHVWRLPDLLAFHELMVS
jgi:nucleoside-diphosphate-sugar epimerase